MWAKTGRLKRGDVTATADGMSTLQSLVLVACLAFSAYINECLGPLPPWQLQVINPVYRFNQVQPISILSTRETLLASAPEVFLAYAELAQERNLLTGAAEDTLGAFRHEGLRKVPEGLQEEKISISISLPMSSSYPKWLR